MRMKEGVIIDIKRDRGLLYGYDDEVTRIEIKFTSEDWDKGWNCCMFYKNDKDLMIRYEMIHGKDNMIGKKVYLSEEKCPTCVPEMLSFDKKIWFRNDNGRR